MPGFDGTGPMGMGPMTGRGAGYCVEPTGTGYGYMRPSIPFSAPPLAYQGFFGTPPYRFYPFGVAPFRFPFWFGRGRRPWGQGRFFGRGRGFGRR